MRTIARHLLLSILLAASSSASFCEALKPLTAKFVNNVLCFDEGDAACQIFLMAAYEGFAAQAAMSDTELAFCEPEATTGRRRQQLFQAYVRRHPEYLNLSAALVFYKVLVLSYPCAKQ